jgi:hypothetical protein
MESVVLLPPSPTQPRLSNRRRTKRLVGLLALLVVFAGCRTPPKTFATLDVPPAPAAVEPLLFEGEGAPADDDPLVQELVALRGTIERELQLPSSNRRVHVHVFADETSYREFTRQSFPELADRRALFVEVGGLLNVFTRWGNETAEDLRHEVTHGYLHASLSGLPLWLDEGLAEFYEVPPAAAGWNAPHAARLSNLHAAGNWRPDLERLEQLDRPGDMQQVDYAEAWAWSYWMLKGSPEAREVLLEYLRDARTEVPNPPLSARLAARLEFEGGLQVIELVRATPR